MNILHEILRALETFKGFGVYLDNRALIGNLAPALDTELYTRYGHMQRGNVR